MCQELKEVLSGYSMNVDIAYDGLTGIRLIKKNKYDILLLDLIVPFFNGYQILDFIKRKKIKILTFVITGSISYDPKDTENARSKNQYLLDNADFLMIKPFNINEMIKIFQNL